MTGSNFSIIFEHNIFNNNIAQLGGGAIYLLTNFQTNSLLKSNSFQNNRATFGHDIGTIPLKLRLKGRNYDSTVNKTIFKVHAIPGITYFNLTFELIDFYNQTHTSSSGE